MNNPQKTFFAGCLLVVSFGFSSNSAAVQDLVVDASETSLRKVASKVVMPAYPEGSIKRGSKGVAVAQLIFDGEGNVSQVKVLEAPDALIEEAVSIAVSQWKFRASKLKDGPPIRVRGKLTFYYVINEKGEGTVENPKQYR